MLRRADCRGNGRFKVDDLNFLQYFKLLIFIA